MKTQLLSHPPPASSVIVLEPPILKLTGVADVVGTVLQTASRFTGVPQSIPIHDTVLKIRNIGNCNIDVKLRRKVLFTTTLKARGHSVVAARKLHI